MDITTHPLYTRSRFRFWHMKLLAQEEQIWISPETSPSQLRWSKFGRQFSLLILHKLSINPHKSKKINLVISVDSKLSFLRGLSRYQENLIEIIKNLRGNSWTYKDISEYLVSKGYRSSRGKDLSPKLVERMYKKYLKKIERENNIEVYLDKTSIK